MADDSEVAGGASGGNHDDERGSGGGVKGQMNILDQVLHADCKPVLEFSLVSAQNLPKNSGSLLIVWWTICYILPPQKPGTELRFKGAIVLVG